MNPLLGALRWQRLAHSARQLRPYLLPVRFELAVALACSLGSVLMVIARPWPLKLIFDYALLPAEHMPAGSRAPINDPIAALLGELSAIQVVGAACLLLFAISVLWGIFTYNQRRLLATAGQKVTFALRRKLFSHLQRLSLSFHRQQRIGDLLLRATGDVNLVRDMMVDVTLVLLTESFVLLAMLAVMSLLDWRLTLVSVGILPLMVLTIFRISSGLRRAVRRQRKKEGRVATMFGEMLQAVAVIQVFGREHHEEERFAAANRQNLREGVRTARLQANLERTAEMLIATGTAAVLWFGVRRVLTGDLTPGDLLVFTSYVAGMYRPLRRIAAVSGRLAKAATCAERVSSLLEVSNRIKIAPGAVPAPRFRGRVTFKNVCFAYEPSLPVLRDVSFKVTAGQTVAIVGPNGAGKSTLCGLLPRLYDPTAGAITIDGRKISHFTLESLREQIGVVLQQPLLFAGTIRENIAYGHPAATMEEIGRAARMAEADDFIRALPDGYDTVIGERGDTLSGGQRQKIAIARAVIKLPALLVLDEPTASLDASSAAQVNATLSRLARNVTVFRVAHRLEEVRHADLILVIEGGRIAQHGTHQALLSKPGWYRDTYRLGQARTGDASTESSGAA